MKSTTHPDRAQERYQEALRSLPPSGGGGCHAALLSVANLGALAGLTPQQVYADLRQHVHGSRRVSDREIQDAVEKAFREKMQTPPPRPATRATKSTLAHLIERGQSATEVDVWEASPIRIDWPPEEDAVNVLRYLYGPEELLFIGERTDAGDLGTNIGAVKDWIRAFGPAGAAVPPLIIPNPLSGEQGLTKSGKPSFRADSCVKHHRFCVVEFDELSRAEQIAFWCAVKLPVAALIDSGNKSIHAWLRVDCASAEEWERDIERRLYGEFLVPIGVDSTCRNESRLSRMPGHRRDGKRWQRLLYLAPEGRPVHE